MISVTDLRAGTTFRFDGQAYIVLKYEHIKVGRGTASIKVKAKNLLTGSVVEKGFISGARVEPVETSKKKCQFLYKDGEEYLFMDLKNYEQISLSSEALGEQSKFLVDGITVDIVYVEERAMTIELPQKMVFTVADTGPGVRGDTASNIYKQATLDNGYVLKVPLFVDNGEKIVVDTRTGEYLERVK